MGQHLNNNTPANTEVLWSVGVAIWATSTRPMH